MSQQWNPLKDLMVLQDRMNRLFEDATQRRARGDTQENGTFDEGDWTPAADIYESEADYQIALDLPGINRSALEISIDDDHLLIKGARLIETPSQRRRERPRGKFVRSFSLPGTVNRDEISADYKDGVLQIHLPKRKEQKAKKVEIKVK
jgi:HSP20 family protein